MINKFGGKSRRRGCPASFILPEDAADAVDAKKMATTTAETTTTMMAAATPGSTCDKHKPVTHWLVFKLDLRNLKLSFWKKILPIDFSSLQKILGGAPGGEIGRWGLFSFFLKIYSVTTCIPAQIWIQSRGTFLDPDPNKLYLYPQHCAKQIFVPYRTYFF